jgi:hypothetical protein
MNVFPSNPEKPMYTPGLMLCSLPPGPKSPGPVWMLLSAPEMEGTVLMENRT